MLPSSLDRPPGGIIATALSRHRLLKADRPLLDTDTAAHTVGSGESANKYDHVPFSDRHDAKPSFASRHPHSETSAVYSTFVENSPRFGSGMVAEALRDIVNSDNGAPNGFLPGGKGTEQSAILGAVWRGQAPSSPFTSPSSEFLLLSDHAARQKAEHLLSLSTHKRSQHKRSNQTEDFAVGSDQSSPSGTPRKIPKKSNEQKPTTSRTNISDDGLPLSAIDHKKRHVLSPDARMESRHGRAPTHEVVSRKEKDTSSHVPHSERNVGSRQTRRKPSISSVIESRASSAASQESSHSKPERISPSRVFPTQKKEILPIFETPRESKRTRGMLTERHHLEEISPKDRTSYKHHLPSVESTSTAEKDATFRRTSLQTSSGQRPSTRRGSDRSQSHSMSTRRGPPVDQDYRQHMSDRRSSGTGRQPQATGAEADPIHTGGSTSQVRSRHDIIPEYPPPSSRSSLRSRRGRVGETNLGNQSPSHASRHLGLKVSSVQGSSGPAETESLNRSNLRSRQEHTLRIHQAVNHFSTEHERIPEKVGRVSTRESISGEVEAMTVHGSLKSQGPLSSTSQEASASDVRRSPSYSRSNRRPSTPDDHSEEISSHQHSNLSPGPPNPSTEPRLGHPSTLDLSVQERLPLTVEEDLQSDEHHQKRTRIGLDDERDALSPSRMSERMSEAKGRTPHSGDARNIGRPLELRLQIEGDNTNEIRDQEASETDKSSFHSRTAEMAERDHRTRLQVHPPDAKTGPSLSDDVPLRGKGVDVTHSPKETSAQKLDAKHKEHPSSPIVDNGTASISNRTKSVEDMNAASRISSTRLKISRNVDSMDDASELRSGILGRLLHEMRESTSLLEGDKRKGNGKRSPTVAEKKPFFRKETPEVNGDHENGIKNEIHLSSASTSDVISPPQQQPSISNMIGEAPTRSDEIASNIFVEGNVDEGKRSGMIGKLLNSSIAERMTNRMTNADCDDKPTCSVEASLGEPTSSIELSGTNKTAIVDEKRDGILGRLLKEEKLSSGRQAVGRIDDEPRYGIIGTILDRGLDDDDAMDSIFQKPTVTDKTQPLYDSPRSGMLGKILEYNKRRGNSALRSDLREMKTAPERSGYVSPRHGMLGMMLAGNGDLAPNRLGRRGSRRGFYGSQIAEAEDALLEHSRGHDVFASRSFPSYESESPIGSERDSKLSIDERSLATDPSTKLLYLAKKGDWDVLEQSLKSDQRFDFSITDSHGFNVLLLAVKDSKVELFKKLLTYGADLYATTNDRRSVAHIAAMYGNEEMMKCILEKKVDLTRPAGPHGQLPLHYACCRTSSRGYRIACLLLQQRDLRLSAGRDKRLPIEYAILYSNIPLIEKLLDKNTEQQIKHVDANGDTLLHLACRKGINEVIQMIVKFGGIDVNATNAIGWTPLHEVAFNGDENALKIMFRLHADANILDKDDKTPLHVAAERGYTRVVETLIDKFGGSIRARTRDGSTLLHVAALSGHADTALAFLKRGVPLYMPNKRGALGLHSAAAAGFTDVVRMLIMRGTNVDIRTRDNYTALHVAVQSGRASVVETLLGFGADVHVQGGSLGETALHIAASLTTEDATECALMLLKSGAQPNVTRSDGETPLHIAARNPLPSMIRLLLSEGADPKLTSHAGESALHVAARSCNSEAARLMLEHLLKTLSPAEIKEFVNAKTLEDGLTAVHYAAEITHDQLHSPGEDGRLINTLIDYGGQPEIQTVSTLETAMHFAARSGNETVLLAMVEKIGAGAVQIVQNKQSKSGWSPLLEACARGHSGVARILLKHHARIDVFDESGRTALHLAAANGHLQLTHMLLQHKAFVNSKSKAGEAPLHLAAQNGHVKVVNLLVQDHGAALEAITLDNQTALHFAAKHGQLAVSQTLLALGANPNARDDKGQTPLHLAAENDFPDVVKLFLKMKQNNRGVLTAVDLNGFTCAHIAAMKGSLAVVKELMMIDKAMVIQAKTKTMEATTLHMAAAGGHDKIVKILLENGANAEDENAHGMTALHLGAKNGFISILDVFDKSLWRKCSRKTGLNALHIAAYYGNTEFVIEMLKHVPASLRSEPPIYNHHVVKEFATEYGFTPLHLAAQSGHDSLVRMLLNQGVQVDATSTTMSVIPLHLAAQQGHIAVVGMLLSRSTQQQHAKDWRGRTPLHLASMNGHYEMVSLLIAQGSNINVMDQNGWTGMHYATKAGHINVVKLFVKSSADAQAETKEGKVPLCFAAAHNHIDCLRFLLKQKHDTHALMEDRKFIFDLMVCGKGTDNEPLKEFILQSPAPIDTAVKLSSLYRDMSEKEKERAKDLSNVSVFAENMAVELLSITASEYNAAILLKAKDNRGRPLLDVLIENEQKEVVSYASVQRYLTEIWTGRVDWSFGKTVAFALVVFLCPPAWFYFSLPLDSRIGRAPIIKFVCHIVSHVYFTMLLTVVVLNLTHKIYEVTSIVPNPVEWVLLLWLSGNLVSELSNVGGGSGLGIVKVLILVLSTAAIAVHIMAFALPALFMQHLDNDERLHFARTMLYLKNQLFAFALLFAFVEFLDFLTVHHLFGPWAIIIRDLMYDLTRFLVILLLFIAGFTLHVTSIFQPAYQPVDEDSADLMRLASPEQTLEMLFFSLFGLVEPDTMPPLHLVPDFAKIILKLLFGIYLLVTLIVLINLLIAMMSDTYQRIQAQSDKEWKFGRAILIRQMNKRSATPAPINMLTKLIAVLRVAYRNKLRVCTQKAQQDLRYEEDIDAFSMNGDAGRTSPTLRQTDDDNEIRNNEELGKSSNWNIETVIDWKRIVEMYYQMNGEVDTEDVHVEIPS